MSFESGGHQVEVLLQGPCLLDFVQLLVVRLDALQPLLLAVQLPHLVPEPADFVLLFLVFGLHHVYLLQQQADFVLVELLLVLPHGANKYALSCLGGVLSAQAVHQIREGFVDVGAVELAE